MNVRAPSVIQLAKLSFLLTPALGGAEVAAAQANDPSTWDTGTLYQRACAACHGSDGSGLAPDHPNYANFESPPADLTDPLFNSREPSADWSMVVKYGGARLGLSAQMPAYGSALTDEQIDDLVAYLKQLVDTSRYPPGDLNFNRPVVTVKAFPEDEVLLINRFSRGSDDTPDAFRTTLYHARRFGPRGQAEAKFSYISFNSGDDLAELELEYKHAVHFNLKRQIINSLGIELAIPFSSDDEEVALVPYWSFGKGLSDSVTFQSNLRAALPVDEPGDGAARLSGIFHWMPSPWPRSVSPALEFTVIEPFESDADTLFTLIPQLYIGLSKGGHVALAVGVEVPVSDIDYDYRIHTFLLWDIADGPLWAGW